MDFLTVLTVKKIEFSKNSRWWTAAILKKTVKSSYLSNRWTDFDEIWQGDAKLPATGDRPLKFCIFQKKQDGGGRHLEKPQKSRYHNNRLTDRCEIWHDYAN